MKKIMILGASILQLPAIEQAKKMGLEVVVADMNSDAVGFSVPGVIKEVVSTIDIPAVLEVAKSHKIDGIMTLASDMPMRTIARVASELHLPGIDEQTALQATDKAVMRECLKRHHVPIPAFFKVQSEEEFQTVLQQFAGKFIIKPADNSGSRGVVLMEPGKDLAEYLDAYHYSRDNSRNGIVVVEEFMEGHEVSVESISLDGECHVLQITDKLTTGAPYFVEMGHNQPSMLAEATQKAIAEVAKAAVKAVGIQNGPSHTEIIVTAEGPKIVELGARLGGDNITTYLVPLSTGINMVECCINIAMGMNPELTSKQNRGAAIRYIKEMHGTISSIEGLEDAKSVENIKQIGIVHGVGATVGKIRSSVDRIGFVIADGKDAEEAIRSCETALKKIIIRT